MKDEFRKIVEHNFFFLEEEFGFMKSIEQSNIIWYSKQKVVIQVAWDFFRSSELSFFIGLIDAVDFIPLFYLWKEFEDQVKIPEFLQVVSIEKADKFIKNVSEFLKKYLESLLKNDNEMLIQIQNKYNKYSAQISYEYKIFSILYTANNLWRNKDYKGFIDAVSSFPNDLPLLEQKKLVYAKKHIDSNKK